MASQWPLIPLTPATGPYVDCVTDLFSVMRNMNSVLGVRRRIASYSNIPNAQASANQRTAANIQLTRLQNQANQSYNSALAGLNAADAGTPRTAQPNRSTCCTCVVIGANYRPRPGTDPRLAWTAGFMQGTSECLKQGATDPVALCLIAGQILASKFESAVTLAGITLTGRAFALQAVLQNLQQDLAKLTLPIPTRLVFSTVNGSARSSQQRRR
jgi:hypothetical protein